MENFSSVTELVPFYEVLISLNPKCNALYESWALAKGQNCEIKWLGEPKGHPGGKPKGFDVLYKYRGVRGNRGTFSQIDL